MGSTCDVAVAVVVEKNVADLIVRGKTNADAQAERLGGIVKRQPCSPRSEGLASVGGRDLRIVHAREQGILHFLLILHSFVLFTPVDLMLLALRALRVVDGIGEVDLPLDVAVLEQANLGMHFVLRAPVGFAVVAVLVCGIQRGALEHQLLFVLVVTVLLVADTVVAHVITEVLVVVRIALSQDHVPTVVVLEARVLLDADLDHFAIGPAAAAAALEMPAPSRAAPSPRPQRSRELAAKGRVESRCPLNAVFSRRPVPLLSRGCLPPLPLRARPSCAFLDEERSDSRFAPTSRSAALGLPHAGFRVAAEASLLCWMRGPPAQARSPLADAPPLASASRPQAPRGPPSAPKSGRARAASRQHSGASKTRGVPGAPLLPVTPGAAQSPQTRATAQGPAVAHGASAGSRRGCGLLLVRWRVAASQPLQRLDEIAHDAASSLAGPGTQDHHKSRRTLNEADALPHVFVALDDALVLRVGDARLSLAFCVDGLELGHVRHEAARSRQELVEEEVDKARRGLRPSTDPVLEDEGRHVRRRLARLLLQVEAVDRRAAAGEGEREVAQDIQRFVNPDESHFELGVASAK
eukprot:scaffold1655_cov247-Pinguiococcus_pyrenoidosus.AAC.15